MRLWLPVVAIVLTNAAAATAQSSAGAYAGLGVGGTYYCIVSRCNTGTTIGALAGYNFTRVVAAEAGVRRHFCSDCDRFTLAEAALLVQLSRQRVRPFAAVGVARSSDADFFGAEVGALGAVGAWIRFDRRWDARIEVRGRQVGGGDAMGEVSLAAAYSFGRK